MAFERLLVVWNEARILSCDRDLLVVDKPSGIVVHGGDERLGEDVVSRLGAWLGARGEEAYLGVHQRLDKDASGVLVFTRRRELNRVVAREMEAHAVRRVYLAVVSPARGRRSGAAALARGGTFEDRLAPTEDGRTRVVARGGQSAKSGYRVLERRQDRILLELTPETGRTHQLRVQLASRGLPIVGDRLYGGAPAMRLMLHARSLELAPLERRFEAPVPEELSACIAGADPSLGTPAELARRIVDAGCRRSPLAGGATAFRLVNDAADRCPGVCVDRYGDFAVLALASDEARARRDELAELLFAGGARGVYVKDRVRADLRRSNRAELAPESAAAGVAAPDPLEVREGDCRFAVRLGAGLSTGLFVDQRENRARVRALAAGANVLNLFCYTGSFSVAAALGGARSTVSVDLSGSALEAARTNFELNGISLDGHRFVRADAVDWLARARRRGERFDLVILDPPSFATVGKRGTFRVARDYEHAAADAFALLGPGGRLLGVTNHARTSQDDLRSLLRRAAAKAGARVAQAKDLPPAFDCPPRFDGAFPSKSVLVTLA